jgi:hypothetical protein
MTKLVQIPRHLLHVGLDDLGQLGVSENARGVLRALLADLPLVPGAAESAVLLGRPEVTLPSLAVVARHVGQGLRDHNLSLAADKARLHVQRRKLIFLDARALEHVLAADDRPLHEAALFVTDTTLRVLELLAQREAAGLASFVTSTLPVESLAHWRQVHLHSVKYHYP